MWSRSNKQCIAASLVTLLSSAACCNVAAQQSVETDTPDIELLEFLGEWATADGEWLDPDALEDGGILDMGDLSQTIEDD